MGYVWQPVLYNQNVGNATRILSVFMLFGMWQNGKIKAANLILWVIDYDK